MMRQSKMTGPGRKSESDAGSVRKLLTEGWLLSAVSLNLRQLVPLQWYVLRRSWLFPKFVTVLERASGAYRTHVLSIPMSWEWHTPNGTTKADTNVREIGSIIFGQCFSSRRVGQGGYSNADNRNTRRLGLWTRDTRKTTFPREDSNVMMQRERRQCWTVTSPWSPIDLLK